MTRIVRYIDPNGNEHHMTGEEAMKRRAQDNAGVPVAEWKGSIITDDAKGVTMTGNAGENSEIAKARQSRVNSALDNAVALATGGKVSEWAHTDPVYSAGDRVNSVGIDNFNREGEALVATGLLTDNARKVADIIDAESRTAIPFNIQDLRMEYRDGSLFLRRASQPNKPGLPLTASALNDLCDYYPATFSSIKSALVTPYEANGEHPAMKADMFNRYVVDRWSKLETRLALPNRRQRRGPTVRKGDLIMWVRKNTEGQWQAYTITSQRNTSRGFDGAAFLRTVAEVLEGSGFYGQVDYSPETTKVSFAGWMMPNHIVDLSAGDVFKAGISGGTSDSKNGGYGLWLSAIRNLCLNLIILATEKARLLQATHLANANNVRNATRGALSAADGALDGLRDEWGIMRATALPDPIEDLGLDEEEIAKASKLFPDTPDAVAVALADVSRMVKLSGVKRDALVEGLLTGWKAEPGETKADILNAVSRLHLLQEIDQYQLARQAGELVPILAKPA